MSLANRALWVIDRHLRTELSLGSVAEACGVSRYHLAHAFGGTTGMPVMAYVRLRRLSEAALQLAAGASNILDLAMEYGYSSHEAFSRAFRTQFGITPEAVRREATVERLPLLLPINVVQDGRTSLRVARYEDGAEMLFVGLGQPIAFSATQAIAALWERFSQRYEEIEPKLDPCPWGVCTNLDDDGNFEYVCAVRVSRFAPLPKGLQKLTVAPRSYAVFVHSAHVSTIYQTYAAIWNNWLPESGRTVADAASLEAHLPAFDPRTGLGGVEIWVPLT
ncbi:MAG TPA: AraC family transcriptional regulator [Rhizomicrobium sp.]|jgi:AraC family transcriptional regulator